MAISGTTVTSFGPLLQITGNEWIHSFFFTGRGWIAVAGQDYGVIRQRVEVFANCRRELIEAAIWEVRTADAPGKQDVAAEDNPRRSPFPQKDNVS